MAKLPSLKDWNPGDSILSRSHHQQVVDALRLLGSPPPNPRFNYRVAWIGKIVEHGKDENDADTDDYEDARYHVQRLAIEAGVEQDGEDAAAFTPDETERVANTDDDGIETGDTRVVNIFTITNLPELAYREPQPDSEDESPAPPVLGCHLLSIGRIVRVWTEHDRANPNARRFVMEESPSPVRVRLDPGASPTASGKYPVKALYDPQEDVDPLVDLTNDDLGEEGPDAILLNPSESATGSSPLEGGDYQGKLIRVNEDGTPVIVLGAASSTGYFPVRCDVSGGVPGAGSVPGPASTCDFVYDVKTFGGDTIGSGVSPERPRLPSVVYDEPPDGSLGIACYDETGELILVEVFKEFPSSEECP